MLQSIQVDLIVQAEMIDVDEAAHQPPQLMPLVDIGPVEILVQRCVEAL
jgi:hypothetical protein